MRRFFGIVLATTLLASPAMAQSDTLSQRVDRSGLSSDAGLTSDRNMVNDRNLRNDVRSASAEAFATLAPAAAAPSAEECRRAISQMHQREEPIAGLVAFIKRHH